MEFNQQEIDKDNEFNHDPENIRELATHVLDNKLSIVDRKIVSQTLAELADQIERLQKGE